MSKIAKKPITFSNNLTVTRQDGWLYIKGASNEIKLKILDLIDLVIDNDTKSITLSIKGNQKQARANWGTMAALIKNAIAGLANDYIKELEIEGIGYRATLNGNKLVLTVGYTHPVEIVPPPSIKITVEKNVIKVSGFDKQLVGEVASKIRKVRPPEPYQGKGIHYKGEIIRRKAGKKAVGTTA